MAENNFHGPLHEEVRFEKSDASIQGILAFALGLVVLGLATHVVVVWLFGLLQARESASNPPLAPLIAQEHTVLPRDLGRIPEPRLEESEGQGLRELRKEEEALLHGYGWVDRKAGVVRIPIEDAIHLLSQPASAAARGIKVRGK